MFIQKNSMHGIVILKQLIFQKENKTNKRYSRRKENKFFFDGIVCYSKYIIIQAAIEISESKIHTSQIARTPIASKIKIKYRIWIKYSFQILNQS